MEGKVLDDAPLVTLCNTNDNALSARSKSYSSRSISQTNTRVILHNQISF
jgi:hypothetical protein